MYLGDQAAVARLLAEGQDPNEPAALRAELRAGPALRLTPLEAALRGAAVREGQAEVIRTLLRLGALAEGETGQRACLALAAEARATVRLLRRRGIQVDRDWCRERGLI